MKVAYAPEVSPIIVIPILTSPLTVATTVPSLSPNTLNDLAVSAVENPEAITPKSP